MKTFLFTAALATAITFPVLAQVSPSGPGSRPVMGGRPPMMRERMEQRIEQLTPAQREEMQKRIEARKAKWDAMTPEQQQQIRANFEARVKERKAKWDALTPEERQAKMAERKAQYDKIQSLPENQRADAMKKLMEHDGSKPEDIFSGPGGAPNPAPRPAGE